MTNISYGDAEKSFLVRENNRFKKYLPTLTPREFFFIFVFLKSNNTVLLVQFEINLQFLKRLVQFQLFEKLTRAK